MEIQELNWNGVVGRQQEPPAHNPSINKLLNAASSAGKSSPTNSIHSSIINSIALNWIDEMNGEFANDLWMNSEAGDVDRAGREIQLTSLNSFIPLISFH